MSYALASKKRKFHRVLDSISNSTPQKPSEINSPTKDQEASTTREPAVSQTIKRVRLTPRSKRDDLIVRPSPGLSKRQSGSSSSLRPNFVPWDRGRFLERLQTFRKVDQWSPKPAAINEVQWAKRGWSCTDVSRVECVSGCGNSLVVKFPDDIDEFEESDTEKIEERKQVRATLVEKYSNLIAEGHAEKCPWRRAGCDDTIQRLPLARPENALLGLRTRFKNLSSLEDKLPSMESLELPEGLDVSGLVEMVPSEVLDDRELDNEQAIAEKRASEESGDAENQSFSERTEISINTAAFTLALFGWDICGDGGAGLASCGACFRRLGLWMYKPKPDGSESIYSHLDVISEHLDYCPWINAKTQNATEKSAAGGPGGQPFHSGWEVLEQAIRTTHRRRTWSDNAASKPGSEEPMAVADGNLDNDARKAKDREWWAKLRRIRQALHGKGSKKPKPSPTPTAS